MGQTPGKFMDPNRKLQNIVFHTRVWQSTTGSHDVTNEGWGVEPGPRGSHRAEIPLNRPTQGRFISYWLRLKVITCIWTQITCRALPC